MPSTRYTSTLTYAGLPCFDQPRVEKVAIQLILRSIPPALNEVYERLLQKLEPKDKRACGIILRLISTSPDALAVSVLYEATQLAGTSFQSTEAIVGREDLFSFQRYVQAVGGGLVEIVIERRWNVGSKVAVCKIIHRSVQTYLDRSGRVELLGEENAQESHHLAWLRICAAFLVDKRGVHFKSPEISTDAPEVFTWGSHAKWSKADDLTSDDSDHGSGSHGEKPQSRDLTEYVHEYLTHHAIQFEQEPHFSSWPFIHNAPDLAFIDAHAAAWDPSRKQEECCYRGPVYMDYSLILDSDVHFAIAHGLIYYLKESLQHDPEVAEIQARNTGSASAYDPRPWNGYHDATAIRASGNKLSLLRTALLSFYHWPSPPGSMIVHYLISRLPRSSDDDMLMAIRKAPISIIEALLSKFPAGPLLLRSKYLIHEHRLTTADNKLRFEYSFGPLWAVGEREDGESVAEVLRLFLSRGEEINRQYGPTGTVLHATLANVFARVDVKKGLDMSPQSFFRRLIGHGADRNAKGQDGNVLEYVWKDAHTHTSKHRAQAHWRLIKFFIDLGATNDIPDPNGTVPSKEYMLGVARSEGPHPIHKYFYKYGRFSLASESALALATQRQMLNAEINLLPRRISESSSCST